MQRDGSARAAAALALLLLAACRPAEPHADLDLATQAARDAAAGQALLQRFECHRCHEGTGLAAPPLAQQCVQCHRDIHAGTFAADRATLHRWQQNIVSFRDVPSLTKLGARLRRSWVEKQLLEPVDVRPGLIAMMPRLRMAPEEAALLARTLVPAEPPDLPFALGDVARGERLYAQLQCGKCHRFAGSAVDGSYDAPVAGLPAAMALAPDLAFARERLPGRVVLDWIVQPDALLPGTAMPTYLLTPEQALDLAAFVMTTPLTPTAVRQPPVPLPLLAREVRFDEVAERVFVKLCWHCHSEPELARGDGGPGNTGGFGSPPRRLDLSNYEAVASGYLDDAGERRSLFARDETGTPRLIASLMARYQELAGAPVAGLRGMPLAMPPLPLQDIQLVESWIAQGRPR